MKNVIHEEVLKEIFPRKYKRRQISQEIYEQIKKMILSGQTEEGPEAGRRKTGKSAQREPEPCPDCDPATA